MCKRLQYMEVPSTVFTQNPDEQVNLNLVVQILVPMADDL